MKEQLYFKKEKLNSFDELIYRFNIKEFKSPYRSTIPLLILCKTRPNHLLRLAKNIEESSAEYIFEFETPTVKGKGSPSCTDLMIKYSSSCIAIEAKWTEPAYISVDRWIKKGNIENRKQVLEGWLEIISNLYKINISIDMVIDLPYQLIHRTASACSLEKKDVNVIYLCFDLSKFKRKYYTNQLSKFSLLLEGKINFYLAFCEISKMENQNSLEVDWKNGNRNLSNRVLQGLSDESLMIISKLTIQNIDGNS